MLSLGGIIYAMHICSDIEKLFILLPNLRQTSRTYFKNEASDAVVVHKLCLENKFFLVQSTISFFSILSFTRDVQMMCKNQSQSGSSSRQSMTLVCVVCVVRLCSLAATGVATAIRHCASRLEWNLGPVPSKA